MKSSVYVDRILDIEWEMFQKVHNIGGRASCQDNNREFRIMRGAQFMAWDTLMLESYMDDLEQAAENGRNLLREKYAYMMEKTDPDTYDKIRYLLPPLTAEQEWLIGKIKAIYLKQTEQFMKKHKGIAAHARAVREGEQNAGSGASVETYITGELKTYSEKTLRLFLDYLTDLEKTAQKYVDAVFENEAKLYGYKDAEDMDRRLSRYRTGGAV